MADLVLMTFGPIQFKVYPLNFHEYDHEAATDYARKDVLESSPNREWVGENDEEIRLRGRIFPFHIFTGVGKTGPSLTGLGVGARTALDKLNAARRAHQPHQLIQGGVLGGRSLGWFVIERLNQHGTHVGLGGIGRVINWEGTFLRCDIGDPSTYYQSVANLTAA